MIGHTGKAGDAVGRRIAALMDLGDPKFRIGNIKRQPGERLVTGDRFWLVRDETFSVPMRWSQPSAKRPMWWNTFGTEVSFDDGKLTGIVSHANRPLARVS